MAITLQGNDESTYSDDVTISGDLSVGEILADNANTRVIVGNTGFVSGTDSSTSVQAGQVQAFCDAADITNGTSVFRIARSDNNGDIIELNADGTANFRTTVASGTADTFIVSATQGLTYQGQIAYDSNCGLTGYAVNFAGQSPIPEKWRIARDGTFTIGDHDNNPNITLNANGTAGFGTSTFLHSAQLASNQGTNYFAFGANSTNAFVIYNVDGSGVYLINGANGWSSTSDERTKTSLKPITDGLSKVSSLRAVTGRYTADEETVSRSFLIAQDVQKVLPEAVDAQDDEMGTLGMRYTDVIPLLVSALHDAKDRIEALEAEVQQLKGEINNG